MTAPILRLAPLGTPPWETPNPFLFCVHHLDFYPRGNGRFGPAAPLTLEPHLHCAARAHAMDMAERDFFDHTNPDGEDPFARMAKAGYTDWASAAENIAAGLSDPAATVQGWLDSDGHCANMLNPQFRDFGVGFYEGAGQYNFYWTQTFGAPLP